MGEVLTNSQIGGRRNIIINGAMQVGTERNIKHKGDDAYSLDRFRIDVTGGDTSAGAFTMSQATVSDVHDGFTKAIKIDVQLLIHLSQQVKH